MFYNPFKTGPGLRLVRLQVWLSWPLIRFGKRLSNVPVIKWLIAPFFKRPHNELISIPIHASVASPRTVSLPLTLVERLVSQIEEVFLMDECHCAGVKNRQSPRLKIGCLAFGPSTARIHPSHGRYVSSEEAVAHVRKAASYGLVANIAHVWIDALAFQLTRFDRLLFMCLCDDDQCIYRSYLKNRGPSLKEAYKRLPGLEVRVDRGKCTACETCVDACFVLAISMGNSSAEIGETCTGCGVCVSRCPENAISLHMENEEEMYRRLLARIREISTLPIPESHLA